jgi:hypothetical protein
MRLELGRWRVTLPIYIHRWPSRRLNRLHHQDVLRPDTGARGSCHSRGKITFHNHWRILVSRAHVLVGVDIFPNFTWVPQIPAGIPIGAGVLMIFLQGLNCIIMFSLCMPTRYCSECFPEIWLWGWVSAVCDGYVCTSPIHLSVWYTDEVLVIELLTIKKISHSWCCLGYVTLGVSTTALFPVQILSYFYGKRIRAMSKHAPSRYMTF